MNERLQIGNIIKGDIIGLGFYRVHSLSDYHINFECLRLFMGRTGKTKGHITNIHHGLDKESVRIKIDHSKFYRMKVKDYLITESKNKE